MEPPKVDAAAGKDGIAGPKVDAAAGKDGIAGPKVDVAASKDGIAAPKVDVAAGKDGIAGSKVDTSSYKVGIDTQFRSFFLKQIKNISILFGLPMVGKRAGNASPLLITQGLKKGSVQKRPEAASLETKRRRIEET